MFTAAAQSASFAAAGTRLGMDPTTVARRVQRFETALKSTLLIRSPDGLQLTSAGARLLAVGVRVAAAIDEADAEGVNGCVRISASEGFGAKILAPALAEMFKQRRSLSIELAAHQAYLSPSAREVDIAITLTPSTSSRVTVEMLTDYELGLYGSAEHLAERGRPESVDVLPGRPFIGYIEDMLHAPELRYLGQVHPDLHARLTSSSIRAQLEFARAGAGLAVLPCFLVRPEHRLERVLPKEVKLVRTFWMATYHDIKDTARIRSVRSWLMDLVGGIQDVLHPSSARS